MISYRLLKEIKPITEEEKRILSVGEIDRNLYMNGSGDIINAQLLLKEGKLISIRPHTRFVEFPEHSHDYIEVVFMCLGSTTHIINGKEVMLSEGELLFLSRNTRHSIKSAGENDIAINFIILPQFFKSSVSALGDEETPLKKFIMQSLENSDNSDYLLFKVANELPIQNLLENLIWILLNDTNKKRTLNKITLELLFQHLMDFTDSIDYANKEDEIIVKFLKYVDNNFKDASLKEASKLLFCDSSWLSREIKKKTGSNYTDIIKERRLKQAVFYLKNTKMKISDIAADIGFDNLRWFYKIFFDTYKMAPGEMRRTKMDSF